MVEVFKTNVQESREANMLLDMLGQHFPGTKINFDLDDCDKVLRMEGHNIAPQHVVTLVCANGFHCSILE